MMNINFNEWVIVDGNEEINPNRKYSIPNNFNPALFDLSKEITFSEYVKEEEAEIIVNRGYMTIKCEMFDFHKFGLQVSFESVYFDIAYCHKYIDKVTSNLVVSVSTLQIDSMIAQILANAELQMMKLFQDEIAGI